MKCFRAVSAIQTTLQANRESLQPGQEWLRCRGGMEDYLAVIVDLFSRIWHFIEKVLQQEKTAFSSGIYSAIYYDNVYDSSVYECCVEDIH